VKVGDLGTRATSSPTVSTDLGELALGRNVLVAFMPWNGLQLRRFDPALRADREGRRLHSIHIEEFEVMARDTKLGPEEITRDIPKRFGRSAEEPRRAGIVYIGAEVRAGDILVGKITPKGESPMTPEEKAAARHLPAKRRPDVRDTSLRVPPGVQGTSSKFACSTRHGVRQGRARSGDRTGRNRASCQDATDEQAILDRNVYGRLAELLEKKPPGHRPSEGLQERTPRYARGA